MINFDDYASENKTEHNRNWPYRILIIGGSGSGKTNVLLDLIENQPEIDKIVVTNHFNDPEAYTEYLNDMHDVYKKY